jgi:glycosyltransferase involved in cell wall biosynthesis
MVIVVNIRSWKRQLNNFEVYIQRLVMRMVAAHPEQRFFFLSDEPVDLKTSPPANVTTFVLGPASNQLLLQKYWFDVKLPLWLRKIQADVLVDLDGIASLTTKVPQCLLVQNLLYLQEPATYSQPQRNFYKRFMPRFLKKARMVIVPSAYLQSQLAVQYKLPQEKTTLLPYAVPDAFQPVAYEMKESVKAIFTQGHEYFLYKGPIHEEYNLVNLLKAFSFFKKRQQSSWKLVLAGSFVEGENTFEKLLETYKYKEDVMVTGPLGAMEEAEIVASAYALIQPSVSEAVNPAIWEAMRCEVPAMVAATATNSELFDDTVMVFDGHDPNDMAEAIMRLYRHEGERKPYIEKGRHKVNALSLEQATDSLWQRVVQAANA